MHATTYFDLHMYMYIHCDWNVHVCVHVCIHVVLALVHLFDYMSLVGFNVYTQALPTCIHVHHRYILYMHLYLLVHACVHIVHLHVDIVHVQM